MSKGAFFACFVDFKIAFPSVNRNALFYKLVNCEIGGNFLAVPLKNCLMYADDLVSRTAAGLQQRLTRLKRYCQTWGLTVNVLKTKVMVFNKCGEKSSIKLTKPCLNFAN